jgi:spermidine synthase
VLVAVVVNLAVAIAVWVGAGTHELGAAARPRDREAASEAPRPPSDVAGRNWYLAFFGISGFVAIGYEIVWSKIFTIVMEGTLYGFSTVLSAYLLGIAIGSFAIAKRVDAIRDLPRAFGLLHVGIGASVALGILLIGDLPYWHGVISPPERAEIHGLYLIAAPIILLPTALFGAAFPVLIRLYAPRADEAGRGIGLVTAVNTAGSISASLAVSFWWIDALGIDATLYLLLLIEIAVGVAVLLRFQQTQVRQRLATAAPAMLVFALVAGSYTGVAIERAISGRSVNAPSLKKYRAEVARKSARTKLVVEGRTSVVTVEAGQTGWNLQNNGMPEANFHFSPPYRAVETLLLGALPYLVAESPERALMVGFGGGSTVDAFLRTELGEIHVVELEQGVIDAIPVLYRGRPSPLADPRVDVRVNDGRNELLVGRHRDGPRYDVIASQPSHPWLAGAANLFTEEFFELARDNLTPGGIVAIWVNGFHTDAEAVLSVVASFERVFPGSALVGGGGPRPRSSLLLLGGRQPVRWHLERVRSRMAEEQLSEQLALHGIERVEDLLALFEGPGAAFAGVWDGPRNTDDNAFVETRLSRIRSWSNLDFGEIEKLLPKGAPVLPPIVGDADLVEVARSMLPRAGTYLATGLSPKLRRLVAAHGADISAFDRALILAEARALEQPLGDEMGAPLEELASQFPDRPEPQRALGRHWMQRGQDFARAAAAFEAAWRISGDPEDAARSAIAWRRVDPPHAWLRLADVPPSRRSQFPELALVDAERALAQTAGRSELEYHFGTMLAFRDARDGRGVPGLNAALAGLAAAVGDDVAARAFADADSKERSIRAAEELTEARRAAASEHWKQAQAALSRARALLPGDYRVTELAVEIAARRGDVGALAAGFEELRHYAPDLNSAVVTENRLRAKLELPLLPERPPEVLFAKGARNAETAPTAPSGR